MMSRFSPTVRGFVAGLLVIAALWVVFSAIGEDSTIGEDRAQTAATTDQTTVTQPPDDSAATVDRSLTTDATVVDESPAPSDDPAQQFSNLDPIAAADLPIEALDTLDLIANGGPYPFNQDDGVFQNREGILPSQQRGYYREYTVITPSSDDRGARRIVAGTDGDLYYTSDHYSSFKEIVW